MVLKQKRSERYFQHSEEKAVSLTVSGLKRASRSPVSLGLSPDSFSSLPAAAVQTKRTNPEESETWRATQGGIEGRKAPRYTSQRIAEPTTTTLATEKQQPSQLQHANNNDGHRNSHGNSSSSSSSSSNSNGTVNDRTVNRLTS